MSTGLDIDNYTHRLLSGVSGVIFTTIIFKTLIIAHARQNFSRDMPPAKEKTSEKPDQQPSDKSQSTSSANRKANSTKVSPTPDQQLDSRLGKLERAVSGILKSNAELQELFKNLAPTKATGGPNDDILDDGGVEVDEQDVEHDQNQPLCAAAQKFGLDNKQGQPLSTEMAANMTFVLRNKLDAKKVGEVMDSYETPSNCSALHITKLNEEVLEKLPSHARSLDIRIATKVQKPFIKGLTALATAIDELGDSDMDMELKKKLDDALLLLAHSNFELNEGRKEYLKPSLPDDFKKLGKKPATELLFGDDVPKQLKEVKDIQRATSSGGPLRGRSGQRFKSSSFQPYQPTFQRSWKSASTTRGSFLGRRPRGQSRSRGAYKTQ